jgi:hypothetical protein
MPDPNQMNPAAQPEAPATEAKPEPPLSEKDRQEEIGDFITRHVLEKDSVFFEG